jgi:crotonobetainyl-CoA:carnitine CoA-transferase CaiB-like acyl-CoA transferase
VSPAPPPGVGEHTADVLSHGWDRRSEADEAESARPIASSAGGPLAGMRVLDLGAQLAGPFGPMILGDLGADVIKIDPVGGAVGQADSSTWVACQRGKRSILLDLKSGDGQQIAAQLIASADVVHYNLRTGVAERLGFAYEQARAINPRIVFCHVTAYGSSGPLATWPGVDQMGQAICGHEYEQGGTPNGGHPTWYRFGMCDAATGMLSVIGVLEALLARPGRATRVEADILTAGLFMAAGAFVDSGVLPRRRHLDARQMGLGPLYRLYETAVGWLCLAAVEEGHWPALCEGLGAAWLVDDHRFAEPGSRQANDSALAAELEPIFKAQTAASWFTELDGRGVPCEVVAEDWGRSWFEDPEAIASGWVAGFDHPVWGHLEQAGRFLDLSVTPTRVAGPPPVHGADTQTVLAELGYDEPAIMRLRARGAVAW